MTTAVPKIYVVDHRGMVGSAIVRHLLAQGVNQSQLMAANADFQRRL